MGRCEEYERARTVANKVEEEQSGTTKALDKKRRLEEEARNKVSALKQETWANVTHFALGECDCFCGHLQETNILLIRFILDSYILFFLS